MKMTLLDMVQDVLSSLSSDEVNSISDNSESIAIARIIRSSYYDIVAPEHYPENFSMFSLEASTDPTKPVLMTRPTFANSIQWIRYNNITTSDTNPNWFKLTYKPLDTFLSQTQSLVLSDTNVESFTHTVNTSSIQFLYKNDTNPNMYTTFDDGTVIFNAYWADIEATLQKDKTQCWGHIGETFSLSDSYIPVLDASLFPLLLREAEAWAWNNLKNTPNLKAEKKAKEHKISSQRTKAAFGNETTNWFNQLPNYGRSGTISTSIQRIK